jgi:hypothetical protein
MLICTPEGKRKVDEAVVLCIDRHRAVTEGCFVTVYLLTGEQVTGLVEPTVLTNDEPPPRGGFWIQLQPAGLYRAPEP